MGISLCSFKFVSLDFTDEIYGLLSALEKACQHGDIVGFSSCSFKFVSRILDFADEICVRLSALEKTCKDGEHHQDVLITGEMSFEQALDGTNRAKSGGF